MDNREPVTVVGAGLVGSLLSIYLAKRGHDVTVLERRPDSRREKIDAGRSINLAISVRGLYALERVGLKDIALRHAIAMRGRMIHSPRGEIVFQRYGKDDTECIHSISRAWLNQMLMTEAERTERVHIRFKEAVDVSRLGTALVFGADGAGSVVRDALLKFDPSGARNSVDRLSHGYKELSMPARADDTHAMEKHALHIWPRHQFMLIALPNLDGSFTCTLFLPFEGTEDSFAKLKSPVDVEGFFTKHFPDALDLIPNLTEQFFSNPTGSMVTVKCSPWSAKLPSGADAVLIGDAAHAIVPFFGQGMNCGFEDCAVLDEMLAQGRPLSEFEAERKPHSDAIADMAVENFVEMRDKTADPRFLLEKEVERALKKKFRDTSPGILS